MGPHTIQRLAEIWKSRHPELAPRIDKATGLIERVKPIGDLTWEVVGISSTYYVYADPDTHTSTCTCLDSRNGHRCKHRLAVALVWKAGRRK